ncbi:MAG: type VI secretion system-associated protein TagF [Paracoccaceae bacterium]
MAAFGAYGKMPALGDFFRLGAEREFVTPWDIWLQTTLLAARKSLGDRFEDCYMSAPIWRFALPPSIAGTQGVVGVLMPSVDRVGRQFPLTLVAQTGYDEQAALRNLMWQSSVLDTLETLALDALDDTMTRQDLGDRLEALALRPMGLPSRILTSGTSLMLSGEVPDLFCADLALDLAAGQLNRACAWSATIEGTARLILTSGLPRDEMATNLFDLTGHISTGQLA